VTRDPCGWIAIIFPAQPTRCARVVNNVTKTVYDRWWRVCHRCLPSFSRSSILDVGYPNCKKRLDRIAVLLDGAAVDVYAAAAADAGEFYTLQLRVDLDDDTGDDEDIAIAAVSVTYSIDTQPLHSVGGASLCPPQREATR
jgi:hypothetical protein